MTTVMTARLAWNIIQRLNAVAAAADAPVRLRLEPHEENNVAVLRHVAQHFADVGTIGTPPGERGVLLFTPIPLPERHDRFESLVDTASYVTRMGALLDTAGYRCACGTTCASADAMHTHLLERHAIQPPSAPQHQCPHCMQEHTTRALLVAHMHAQHALFPCALCPNVEHDTRERLAEHMAAAHPVFECALCPLKTATRDLLIDHVRMAHAPRVTFQCAQCDTEHTSRDLLIKHTQEAHAPSYQCSRCPLKLGSSLELMSHILDAHSPASGALPPTHPTAGTI